MTILLFYLNLDNTIQSFGTPTKAFENIVLKKEGEKRGRKDGNRYFPLFSQCFLLTSYKLQYLSRVYFVVCKCFQLRIGLKFCHLVKSQTRGLNGVSLTQSNDRTAMNEEQDQLARMCRLILLFTLTKMNARS